MIKAGKGIEVINMNRKLRIWVSSAVLAGALIAGTGAAAAYGQGPNEPAPGTRADQREDRREAKQLRLRILEEQQRLQSDIRQFGRNSPQARSDREQLRVDRRRLRLLRRDRRLDARISNN